MGTQRHAARAIVTSAPALLLAFVASALSGGGCGNGSGASGGGAAGRTGATGGPATTGSGSASGSGATTGNGVGGGAATTGGAVTTGTGGVGGGAATTGGGGAAGAATTTGAGGSGGAADGATLRIHYPAGAHAVTIRGAGQGLSWTTGLPTSASGDTFTLVLAGLTATTEWKPLLDDTTWARGPNYRVAKGQTLDVWPHFTSTQGQVVTLLPAFHSTLLGNDRAVYAYLPASYQENTDATYPVVYMHDGQNLWAALPQLAFGATWNVDTAFDAATEQGACSSGALAGWGAQPLGGTPVTCTGDGDCPSGACRTFPEAIVIGVANAGANRIFEYTPTTDPGTPGGGGAGAYVAMLATELKPALDGMLRTRPGVASTALAGSSLGGLVTAYAGLKRPDVFGLLAAISPSSWWNNGVIVGDVKGTLAAPARPLLVYVDSGQGAVDDEADTDLLAAAYLGLGYVDGTTFRHVVQPGAQHSEVYWAQRFPGAMQLVLGER